MNTQHKIFDTHAHYHDTRFNQPTSNLPPVTTLLDTLFSTQISHILNVGTDIPHSMAAIALAEQYPGMYAAVGMHPSSCPTPHNHEEMDAILDRISALADHSKVVAIGEIGYDFHYDDVPRSIQEIWFSAQMQLARKKDLPVIIHDREAHGAVMDMIAQHPGVRGVLHSYSGSAEMAKQLVSRGWMISVSGVVTFKNARQLVEVVSALPMDSLLIETDCPYLTPEPHRGKVNHSGYLTHTAARIAAIRGISEEDVCDRTRENALRFFRIPEIPSNT